MIHHIAMPSLLRREVVAAASLRLPHRLVSWMPQPAVRTTLSPSKFPSAVSVVDGVNSVVSAIDQLDASAYNRGMLSSSMFTSASSAADGVNLAGCDIRRPRC